MHGTGTKNIFQSLTNEHYDAFNFIFEHGHYTKPKVQKSKAAIAKEQEAIKAVSQKGSIF